MNAHDLILLAYVLPMVLMLMLKFMSIIFLKGPVEDMRSKVFWSIVDAVMPGLNIIMLLSVVLVAVRAMIHDK